MKKRLLGILAVITIAVMFAVNVNVVLSNNKDISLSSVQSVQAYEYGNDQDGECRVCANGTVFIACWYEPNHLCHWTECGYGVCE